MVTAIVYVNDGFVIHDVLTITKATFGIVVNGIKVSSVKTADTAATNTITYTSYYFLSTLLLLIDLY